MIRTRVTTLAIALASCPSTLSAEFQPFATVEIPPGFLLDGAGTNVDTIAFWEAPDPANTLMFVTAKGNSLVEVWAYPFVDSELAPLTHSTFGSSQVNGVVVDQESDLLYVTVSHPASTVSVFHLPSLTFETSFSKPGANYRSEPNAGLLELAGGGKRLYVSADNIVFVHDAVTGDYLSEFTPIRGLETIAGDGPDQILYIPDEKSRTGVYVYDPDGNPYERDGVQAFGGSVFQRDAEGILIYICPFHGGPYQGSLDLGCGLIVVADQRPSLTDFEVFARETWQHLGTFRVTGVSNTDGIASTQTAMPGYPMGLFTAIHHDRSTAGVGWDVIFAATGLSCASAVGVDDTGLVVPSAWALRSTPNPFRDSTEFSFDLPRSGDTSLEIYDVAGRLRRRIDSGRLAAGNHRRVWDGRDAEGSRVGAGLYFVRLAVEDEARVHKVVLAR